MINKKYAQAAAVIVALGLTAVIASPTLAQKKFLERVRKHYNLDRNNGNCALCHEVKPKEEPSKKNLNKFGLAIQSHPDMKPLLGKGEDYKFSDKELDILEKVVVSIENDDCDTDGASNKEELDLGTYPGDSKSVPDKVKLEKYRKDHPPPKK